MGRDIDRKLRLTAALLGTVTRKDLASAFRKANPATTFDVGRADKWLQGRARPREMTLYDDWAMVLGIDRAGSWIATCDVDAFVDEISSCHGLDPAVLRQRAEAAKGAARNSAGLNLAGTYVCYAHSWSPYFRGRLVRGELSVSPGSGSNRLDIAYRENLPTGPMELDGTGTLSANDLRFDVRDPTGSAQLLTFCLFPPKPPASVLCGLMFGTALIGPEAQPSMARVVLIRLPSHSPALRSTGAYLPPDGSLSEDLAHMGLTLQNAAAADRELKEFLSAKSEGVDQAPVGAYRTLLDFFDRNWLAITDTSGQWAHAAADG